MGTKELPVFVNGNMEPSLFLMGFKGAYETVLGSMEYFRISSQKYFFIKIVLRN